VHDSRGIEIVNFSISLALSAGTLMASAGTPYRLVPAHFYPCCIYSLLAERVVHAQRYRGRPVTLRSVFGREAARLGSGVRLQTRAGPSTSSATIFQPGTSSDTLGITSCQRYNRLKIVKIHTSNQTRKNGSVTSRRRLKVKAPSKMNFCLFFSVCRILNC